jgi:sugar fermentation stimulation protein A
MTYSNIHIGYFLRRPNRFIAHVEIDGAHYIAHVKNTGRCKELLIPGAKIVLQRSDNPARTTKYDLIAVWKGERLINMDSQAPNKVFQEYLQAGKYIEGVTFIKPEAKHGGSRFDFYVEAGTRKLLIEVKGVTLEEENIAMFPDAPTERGVKHLNELAQYAREGFEAHAVFVVQMKDVRYFTPNDKTHAAFGEALTAAFQDDVKVDAFECLVTENGLSIGDAVPIKLQEPME